MQLIILSPYYVGILEHYAILACRNNALRISVLLKLCLFPDLGLGG